MRIGHIFKISEQFCTQHLYCGNCFVRFVAKGQVCKKANRSDIQPGRWGQAPTLQGMCHRYHNVGRGYDPADAPTQLPCRVCGRWGGSHKNQPPRYLTLAVGASPHPTVQTIPFTRRLPRRPFRPPRNDMENPTAPNSSFCILHSLFLTPNSQLLTLAARRGNAKTALDGSRAAVEQNKEGFSINRTFSCSYGQLQTSAYASGWG